MNVSDFRRLPYFDTYWYCITVLWVLLVFGRFLGLSFLQLVHLSSPDFLHSPLQGQRQAETGQLRIAIDS